MVWKEISKGCSGMCTNTCDHTCQYGMHASTCERSSTCVIWYRDISHMVYVACDILAYHMWYMWYVIYSHVSCDICIEWYICMWYMIYVSDDIIACIMWYICFMIYGYVRNNINIPIFSIRDLQSYCYTQFIPLFLHCQIVIPTV